MFTYGNLLDEMQMFCRFGAETGIVGESELGQQIPYVFIGQKNGNCMIVQAAIHAREHLTALLAVCQAKYLLKNSSLTLLGGIYFVPMVNPDGVDLVNGVLGNARYEQQAKIIAAQYPDIPYPDGWKANIDGVDLNLQFPAGWEQARTIKFSQGYTTPAPRDYVGEAPLTAVASSAHQGHSPCRLFSRGEYNYSHHHKRPAHCETG